MNPFNVLTGHFEVRGQVTMGYAIGVRMLDINVDALVFAPTKTDAIKAAGRMLGATYGESRQHQCCLIDERQLMPLPEVREATMDEWAAATQPGELG